MDALAVVGVPAANADVDDVLRGREVLVQQLQRAWLLQGQSANIVHATHAALSWHQFAAEMVTKGHSCV
jgi:hypothetical protein